MYEAYVVLAKDGQGLGVECGDQKYHGLALGAAPAKQEPKAEPRRPKEPLETGSGRGRFVMCALADHR